MRFQILPLRFHKDDNKIALLSEFQDNKDMIDLYVDRVSSIHRIPSLSVIVIMNKWRNRIDKFSYASERYYSYTYTGRLSPNLYFKMKPISDYKQDNHKRLSEYF